ncbi:histidinol dehydrogenase [Natronocella acetinitrilica]|uniref:Histidinol dehydrogenase n=1 Tax=Natronocella acetinitrilica TaxID=414046 RepID=A0AAE3KBQ1_9GAMM|nr:histidinol dehydrogenase [Natronocella acetinitrilica]MCP1673878.1 histidinol dehydrogenase [Natronocella acetinitrilica]
MLEITRLSTTQPDFPEALRRLVDWEAADAHRVQEVAAGILADVRKRGDAAVLEYGARFDRLHVDSVRELEIDHAALKSAFDSLPADQREALQVAADRVRAYAERQKVESFSFEEADGTRLGQKVEPLDRVGIYVPGGKAAYPSSVLMNAVPAAVAGVSEIIMMVPAPDGQLAPMVLAAAYLGGVTRAFRIGGAQAVAALAYGTETVPAVDKIVGPGNAYVAEAKRQVFGVVGIDMIAGPSEILVVCDGHTDPEWIAMDLFSQAEHDEDAQAILVCPDPMYLDQVQQAMERLLPGMERSDIIRTSLARRGALICTRDLTEAVDVVNTVAPEHLELSVAEPEKMADSVRHAGAIFLGRHTAEVLGDYVAGPDHVLPTSRTARFASPLGVYDFQKRTSLIQCSPAGAAALGRHASVLARTEGLTAHARSAEYRVEASGRG